MRGIWIILVLPAICFGVAAYLAIHDKDGWGWFLFVGILCCGSVKWDDSKKKKEKQNESN